MVRSFHPSFPFILDFGRSPRAAPSGAARGPRFSTSPAAEVEGRAGRKGAPKSPRSRNHSSTWPECWKKAQVGAGVRAGSKFSRSPLSRPASKVAAGRRTAPGVGTGWEKAGADGALEGAPGGGGTPFGPGNFKTCPRVRDRRLGVGAWARWCCGRTAARLLAPLLSPSPALPFGVPPL